MNRSTRKGTQGRVTKFKRRGHARVGQLSEQEQYYLKELIRTKVSAATKRCIDELNEVVLYVVDVFVQVESW